MADSDAQTSQTSTATVDTPRGGRYGKQLTSHFSRRLRTEWDDDAGTGSIWFGDDLCRLETQAQALVLHASAAGSLESLENLEDVVARHLVRFGTRDELVVTWVRPDGSEGRTFRHTDDRPDDHTPPA